MAGYEFRAQGSVEIRGEGDEPKTLYGISPPWNTLSAEGAIMGGFREKFERGAFRNLSDDGIIATIEHDNSKIIGRASAGTLELRDTPDGLEYSVTLNNTQRAKDLIEDVRTGNLDQSSFEFFVPDEEGDRHHIEDGTVIRTVLPGAAVLRQVGPVASGAFKDKQFLSARSEAAVAELTAPKVDEEAARERRLELCRAELELAESELGA